MIEILDTSTRTWGTAKKIQGIEAKPMANVFADPHIAEAFLVDTLEGVEPVDENSMLCVGRAGDIWQQSSKALLKKYDLTGIDAGWLQFEPKPENEVEFFYVEGSGYIKGKWGATVSGVENLQAYSPGDSICRQLYDHEDQWVVRARLFDNTYEVLS